MVRGSRPASRRRHEALIDQRVSELLARVAVNGEAERAADLTRLTPDVDQRGDQRVPCGTAIRSYARAPAAPIW